MVTADFIEDTSSGDKTLVSGMKELLAELLTAAGYENQNGPYKANVARHTKGSPHRQGIENVDILEANHAHVRVRAQPGGNGSCQEVFLWAIENEDADTYRQRLLAGKNTLGNRSVGEKSASRSDEVQEADVISLDAHASDVDFKPVSDERIMDVVELFAAQLTEPQFDALKQLVKHGASGTFISIPVDNRLPDAEWVLLFRWLRTFGLLCPNGQANDSGRGKTRVHPQLADVCAFLDDESFPKEREPEPHSNALLAKAERELRFCEAGIRAIEKKQQRLQSSLNAFEEKRSALQEEIDALNERLQEIDAKGREMRDEMTDLENEIDAHEIYKKQIKGQALEAFADELGLEQQEISPFLPEFVQ